jgi:hypothetical protein
MLEIVYEKSLSCVCSGQPQDLKLDAVLGRNECNSSSSGSRSSAIVAAVITDGQAVW